MHGPVLSYIEHKCMECRACEAACAQNVHCFENGSHQIRRDQCISCGKCVAACATGALECIGREYSVDEVVEAAARDRLFYRAGGGVTLTGGEPLAQGRFAIAVARALHEKGIGVCVETSGYADPQVIREILPYIDLFLFDIKETDDDRHRRYTGVGLAKIHENLRLMDQLGARIILRCPVIPGVNDRKAHFDSIADLAHSLAGLVEINIEPYHPMGIEKNRRIGETAAYSNEAFMEKTQAECWREYLAGKTQVPVLVMG